MRGKSTLQGVLEEKISRELVVLGVVRGNVRRENVVESLRTGVLKPPFILYIVHLCLSRFGFVWVKGR